MSSVAVRAVLASFAALLVVAFSYVFPGPGSLFEQEVLGTSDPAFAFLGGFLGLSLRVPVFETRTLSAYLVRALQVSAVTIVTMAVGSTIGMLNEPGRAIAGAVGRLFFAGVFVVWWVVPLAAVFIWTSDKLFPGTVIHFCD